MCPDTSGGKVSDQPITCPDVEIPMLDGTGGGHIGPIHEKLLLTTEDLSFLLGLAVVTLKNSRKTGLLLGRPPPPHLKVGRLVRYRREDVVEWVQALPTNHD